MLSTYKNTVFFLLKSQIKFSDLGSINFHGNSAMDESAVLIGRPFGGCAIIWRSTLHAKFFPIDCVSKRLCAGILTLNSGEALLLINLYLPCDNRYQSVSYNETVEVLNEAMLIIQNNSADSACVGGDFNADLARVTPQVTALKEFLLAAGLKSGIHHNLSDIDYTYESKSNGSTSIIDHLCLSENIFDKIMEYHTVKLAENMSDHDGLLCTIEMNVFRINECVVQGQETPN